MSSAGTLKTIQEHESYELQDQMRDVRTTGQKIYAILQLPRVAGFCYLSMALLAAIFPVMWPVVLVAWFTLWFTLLGQIITLPFNLPFTAKTVDYNDNKPGRTGHNEAQGVYFAGNDMESNEELYLNFSTLLRHVLCFGTTGAGKTETLASMGANFIATGAGLIYNDAKASPKLSWQIYTIGRFFGRDDDFLTINYLNADSGEAPDPAERLTNDSAPFAFGSAEASTQLVISLMPQDKGGANKVFSEAAVALISSVMPALTELRDQGLLLIDPKVIRSYMEYDNCTQLMFNPNISSNARQAIIAFIKSRSGYDANKPPNNQPEEVKKQFGFAQSYFIRALSSLSDTYGHIYMTGAGEVDFRDVILNDRILCTLLPSMQYSGEELANLGKIILSAIRNAMATGLGHRIEGSKEDVLESLPTATNRPSGIINDEYAYMAVEGFAVTAAQGRGLNFCMVFAGQDYAGFKSASEKEAEQIVANCRFKYIMALEDAGATLELVKKIAGETYVSLTQGFENDDSITSGYRDSMKSSIQKVETVTPKMLRSLDMGEGFAFYMDKIVLMRNFWHGFTDSDLVSNFRIGRRMLMDFRPRRGPMVKELAQDAHAIRKDLKIWVDHLEPGEVDSDILVAPKSIQYGLEKIRSEGSQKNLNSAEQGLYFLGAMFEDDIEDDGRGPLLGGAEGSNDSVLSSIAGTFGGGEDAEDEDMQNAVEEVKKFFMELDIDEQNPEASPLTSESSQEEIQDEEAIEIGIDPSMANEMSAEELLEKEFDVSSDSQTSTFTPNEESVIARGIAKIEVASGSDVEEAKQAGKVAVEQVRKATTFPKDPRPTKKDADKDRLESLIKQFIAGSDEQKEPN